jgi:hypothetical protein
VNIDAFINDYSLDDSGSEAALENLLEAYRKGSYELVERYGKKLVNAMTARIERAHETEGVTAWASTTTTTTAP